MGEANSSSQNPAPLPTELIFIGTGTSGALPVVACLTSPNQNCSTCLSPNPKNTRLNTSGLFRITLQNGETKNLLVDCGKTFYSAALRRFPQHKLRKIDALLLTHAHADAFFGLDDLRAWTMESKATNEPAIQPYVDVYCDRRTMEQVALTFPYLVDKNRATGGGDIPSFKWHVFGEDGDPECRSGIQGDDSFVIPSAGGVKVTPLPVEHGTYMGNGAPFMCLGFRVGDFSWVSDCSGVPEKTEALMQGSKVVIMDGLKWDPHSSHFSIQQGREWVRDHLGPRSNRVEESVRLPNGDGNHAAPRMTWLVGFSHNVEHEHATEECADWSKSVEGGGGLKVAPAWDGLRVGLDGQPI